MRVLIFSTTLILHISHSKKNSAICYHICTQVFLLSTRYSCQILMKLEFLQQIFEKYSNIKFRENPSIWSRVFPCGRTDRQADRHEERNSL
jgi:hypothetical protein